jgi:hypothetical protein
MGHIHARTFLVCAAEHKIINAVCGQSAKRSPMELTASATRWWFHGKLAKVLVKAAWRDSGGLIDET